jgi:hypothetical protein
MLPVLTLFTAPKPFTNPHIALIQRNALQSWRALRESAEIVLIGSDEGIAEAAAEFGFRHLPDVPVNALGTPLISGIFKLGREANQSPLLGYVNTDIILFPDFVDIAQQIAAKLPKFLLVGQRWDLEVTQLLNFEGDWAELLRRRTWRDGKLHERAGSDYFVFPRACFQHIPDFTVGRAGWDNWMIFKARQENWPVVDCTSDLDIIHQNHDYSHLPNGQPHYRLPETGENIRLAGGRRTIFDLNDASHRLVHGDIEAMPRDWKGKLREFQNRPMLKNNNFVLTQLLFTLLQPKRAWVEFWKNREMRKIMQSSQKLASK